MRSIGFLNRYFSELAKIVANGAKWAPPAHTYPKRGFHSEITLWTRGDLRRPQRRFCRLRGPGTDIPGPYKSFAASCDVMWLPKMCFLLEPVLGKLSACKGYAPYYALLYKAQRRANFKIFVISEPQAAENVTRLPPPVPA